MSARNRQKYEAAQADRSKIAALLRVRSQSDPLLTPKEILKVFDWPHYKLRTAQRHLRAIRSVSGISDAQ